MASALSEAQIDSEIEQRMLDYFAMAADHLINTAD
jgi:truncated hemoglobin YjbI|tara:strand:- start:1183 stop:1287 length:105 start_codon:yes stop_codon:yes gene_type:complete